MNSVILSFIIRFFNKICKFFSESKFFLLLCKFDLLIKKTIKKSCVYSFLTNKDNFDESYKVRISGPLYSFKTKLARKMRFIIDLLNNSSVNRFIKNFVTGFINISIRKIGVLLSCTFFISAGRYIIIEQSKIKFTLFVTLLFCSLIMLFIKSNINELLRESFFFHYLNISATNNKSTFKYGYLVYAFIGLAAGLLSFLFGPIPTILSFISIIFVYWIFSFSFVAVSAVIILLPFFPTMVLVALALLTLGTVCLKRFFASNNALPEKSTVMNFAIITYLISLCFATVFSFTPIESLKISLVYFSFVLFYFAIVKTVDSSQKIINIIYSVVIASIPVSVYGIIQKIVGFEEQSTWHDENMFEEIGGRVVSFFENPNVFGEYLIWIVIISLSVIFISKTKFMKVMSVTAFVAACMSMVFTYSRGCWIGVLIAIAIYLFLTNRKVFWGFMFCGLISLFFLPDSIISRMASVGDLADTSTSYRVYIWKGTFELLKDYWVTGIGMGSSAFNEVYPLYAYSAIRAPHPHNLYLLIISEMGIFGGFSILFLLFIYYKNMVKTYVLSKHKNYKILSAAFISAMTGYLIQGLFDNVWYNYRIYFLFWIFIALATVIYLRNKEETFDD